jgi:hypothetical protein
MAEQMTDDSRWVNGVAARLRVLQASFADEQPGALQGYLVEEIGRALKQLPTNRRKPCLKSLADQFPAWQSQGDLATAGTDKPPPTSDELLDQFLDSLPSDMREATRAKHVQKLTEAGLVAKTKPAAAVLDLPPDALRRLGIGSEDRIDADRAAKLLARLTEVISALDQFVWLLWKKELAPASNIRPDADLSKLLGPCLKGDSEISTQLVSQSLERTRKMILAVLTAIGGGSANYAAKYTQRFSEEAIVNLANIERKAWQSVDVKAWEVFKNLSKQYATEAAIEKEVREAIAKRAEKIMAGGGGTNT